MNYKWWKVILGVIVWFIYLVVLIANGGLGDAFAGFLMGTILTMWISEWVYEAIEEGKKK